MKKQLNTQRKLQTKRRKRLVISMMSKNYEESKECIWCSEEHRQLAKWLKDYKRLLEQQPCDDAISRGAVLEGLKGCICEEWIKTLFATMVKLLPPVTPQQKSGKWIRWREEVQRGTHYTENIPHCKCSECDTEYDIFASRFINYCPNCGAKMIEPQESEDKE